MNNFAIGAFYVKHNINNLQTIKYVNIKKPRSFALRDDYTVTGPNYILCEPSVSKAGTQYIQMSKHAVKRYQDIPTIEYDVFSAFQLLPPEAYFEYAKSLMKPYGEN